MKKIIAGFAVLVAVASFAPAANAALTQTQVSAIIGLLTSFGADASTIANVQASLTGGTPSVPASGTCGFARDLTIGSAGADVSCLQRLLIAGGYSLPAGATGYFGAQTQTAVIAWQKSKLITPASGYFGKVSRGVLAGAMDPGTSPIAKKYQGTGYSFLYPSDWTLGVDSSGTISLTNLGSTTAGTISIKPISGSFGTDSSGKFGTVSYSYVNGQWVMSTNATMSGNFATSTASAIFTVNNTSIPVFTGAIPSTGWGQYDYIAALSSQSFLLFQGPDAATNPHSNIVVLQIIQSLQTN